MGRAAVGPDTRVLFLATSLAPGAGGIQRVGRMTARVLRELLPRDQLQIHLLADDRPPEGFDGPVRAAKGSRVRFVWSALRSACTHLVTDACNLGQLQWLPTLRGKPLLTFLHGVEIWEQAKPRWVRSARGAAVPVFVSEFSRRRAELLHGPFPGAHVCPLATETDDPPPPRPTVDGPPEVLIVGRMFEERYKGHHELIAAWPRVKTAVPGAILRIVGRGPGEPALRALAGQSAAAGQIVFEGFVPDARVEELYARATAFAMPSRGEGFGLVYIEAMRHGLPVIASVHDAGPEVVADGMTGFTVDLDRPGHLADRLIDLLKNNEVARRLGDAGRDRWARLYRFSCYRDRLAPILTQFLAR
jgi:phosphatidylinositol alpha-1,6-mannosyltransferase